MLNNDDDNFNNSRLVIHTMMANCFEQFKMKKIVVIHFVYYQQRDENGKIQFFLPSKINNNNNAEEVTELQCNGLHY